MAWTAPMTAVDNTAFTAQQFNQNVRDNLMELAPAKAGTPGGYFVSIDDNSLEERVIMSSTVATAQTTTSGVFADLATVGPQVTVNTGTSVQVFFGADMASNANVAFVGCAVEVSGASSFPANLQQAQYQDGIQTSMRGRSMASHRFYTLTPGNNVFTLKYISNAVATATFQNRELIVMPL